MTLKKLFMFICTLSAFFPSLQASHYMGAELTYNCVNACTYRIYQRFYLDCSGAATAGYLPVSSGNAYPANPITFRGTTSGLTLNPVGTGVYLLSWGEVTPVCPGASATGCSTTGAAIPGVAEAIYYQDYNLCNLGTNLITVEFSNCCRNYAITSGQGGNGMYVSTNIDLSAGNCNNSPYFVQPPVTYICAATNSIYQGAYDPDGDSLSYALGNCFSGANTSVTYSPGYTSTQPLGSSWNVSINPVSGIVSFAPNPGAVEVVNMCINVMEWRKVNGVYTQIGQVSRDIQVTVLNCPNPNDEPHLPAASVPTAGIQNLVGGTLSNGTIPTITVVPNSTLDFDFAIEDADATGIPPTQTLQMSWIQNISGLNFSNAANSAQTNVITGATGLTAHINWQAPASGSYVLVINAKDDACPIPAIFSQGIKIIVGCSYMPTVSETITNCTQLHVDVVPSVCMTLPITYQWTGISPTPAANGGFDYDFNAAGSFPYSLTLTDASGATATYTNTVTINNPSTMADAGADITVCIGSTGVLGTNAQANFSYQWASNPANTGFVSATNTAQPNVAVNLQGNMVIPVSYMLTVSDGNGCVGTDTANVTFINTPNATFSIDTTSTDSCLLLTYTGYPYPNALYHWVVNGSVMMSGTGSGPYTVCYDSAGTYDIGLWVEIPNACNSDTTIQTYAFPPTATFKMSSGFAAVNTPVTINYQGLAKANSSFAWNFNGGTVLSGSGAGPYQVSWGSMGTKNVTLTLTTPDYPTVSYTQSVLIVATDIEKPFGLADISLAPNPASQVLTLKFAPPRAQESSITLISATGQKLQNWNFGQEKEVKLQVEVENLPKGVYFMLIKVGEQTLWHKWVKE